MYRKLIIALLLIFPVYVRAQDHIIKKSGEEISATVLEVKPGEIRYRLYGQADNNIYALTSKQIALIRYEDGRTDSLKEQPAAAALQTTSFSPELYNNGKLDASKYYKRYKTAGTATLLTSLVSPLIGLIPAVGCSNEIPTAKNLGYPDESLMRNKSYAAGYEDKAMKIKKARVWSNWGIGFGVNFLAFLYLVSAANR